jgi:hypothetical protein
MFWEGISELDVIDTSSNLGRTMPESEADRLFARSE